MRIDQSPQGAPAPPSSSRRHFVAVLVGLSACVGMALALPSATYTARAIVAVGAGDDVLRTALARATLGAVSSKPVLLRAAAALVAGNVSAPEPSLTERLAVSTGLGGVHATGRDARLADALVPKVRTMPGESLGTIEIAASDPLAETAAMTAGAVADAFVADQEDHAAEARRQREIANAARIEALIRIASAAHARLASLGGSMVDPAQARTTAATQTATAQTKVDLIHAIIASGTPPISDRKDVPEAVASAQRAYLDIAAQLAKARETLGDRHTTIISLKDGVAHAAATLTAEWKRLDRAAQLELGAARDREAGLRKAEPAADVTRRAAIEDARASARMADAAVAKAEAARLDPQSDERPYRILSRATVPSVVTGFGALSRAGLAFLAGLCVFGLVRFAQGRGTSSGRPTSASDAPAMANAVPLPKLKPAAQAKRSFFDETEIAPLPAPVKLDGISVNVRRAEPPTRAVHRPHVAVAPEREEYAERDATKLPERRGLGDADGILGVQDAMRTILSRFETIELQFGVPTIMVAANESGAGTAEVALSFARAAARTGRRVLVVEAAGADPVLAGAADQEAEPVLVDVFGTLRVGVRAEDKNLYLAPSLRNGARIATDLARDEQTPLIDELADAFDLVIVDGARAGREEALADVYLRVGRFASRRDDERFLTALGATSEAFGGSMIGRVFFAPTAPHTNPTFAPARDATAETARVPLRRPAPSLDRDTAPLRRRVASR